jgi:2-dehydropantoate 2-reductase
MMMAAEEGEQVAKSLSIKLLYPSATEAVRKVCIETSHNFSSMLQDIVRKRQTEIDYINGVIVREGLIKRMPVETNQFFYDEIKKHIASA